MRMRKRSRTRLDSLVLCGLLGLVITACGRTGSAVTSPQPSAPTMASNSTATVPAPPTATSSLTLGADPCTSASDPTILLKLNTDGIPVPEGASVVEKGFAAADGMGQGQSIDYEKIGACAKASAPGDVQAFYAAQMPAAGWKQSALFPYQGILGAACGDPYCWTKAQPPHIFDVSLESVQVTSNGTAFTLDIATSIPSNG